MKRLFKSKGGKNTEGAVGGHRRRSSEGHSFDWLDGNPSAEAVRINKQGDTKRNGKSKVRNRTKDHHVKSPGNDNRANDSYNNDSAAHDNSEYQLTDIKDKKSPILRSKSTSFEPDIKLLDQNEDESITQTVTRSLMSAISREDNSGKIEDNWATSSRLNKTLAEVLHDKNSLPYLIEFMDSIKAISLLRFWLAAESFTSSHPLSNDEVAEGDCSNVDDRNSIMFKSIQNDAISLYDKYISLEATEKIRLSEDIRVRIEGNICCEDGRILPDCFKEAQNYSFNKMERIFPFFLCSEMYSNYQVDILTSTHISVADILYNEMAMFYFMEFMEQENALNYLQFWQTAENFRQQLENLKDPEEHDAAQAQDDAMIIYNKYFSLQATKSLGIDDIVRFEIENNICQESGPTVNCFKTPQKYTYYLIEEVFLPSFLHSNLYFKYLSELVNSSQQISDIMTAVRPIIMEGSDEDDEELEAVSLQAMGRKATDLSDVVPNSVKSTPLEDSVKVEPPTAGVSLHRPLSFGYVDKFGRFVTEAEPEPGQKKKQGSRLTRAVQKITRAPDQQTEDEMAWKVAMMILRDVQSEQRIGEKMLLENDDRTANSE